MISAWDMRVLSSMVSQTNNYIFSTDHQKRNLSVRIAAEFVRQLYKTAAPVKCDSVKASLPPA